LKAHQPILPYFGKFLAVLGNKCSLHNPSGLISLCVAENKLPKPRALIRERFQLAMSNAGAKSSSWEYDDMSGLAECKASVSSLFNRLFLTKAYSQKEGAILMSPSNLVFGAGAASILDGLFNCLCESGMAVLIPSPYYAAFENDMSVLSGLIPIPCPMEDMEKGPTAEDLQATYERDIKGKGLKLGMVLICNPNNPLGVIYDQDVLRDVVKWSRGMTKVEGHVVHTLVDVSESPTSQNHQPVL
jgi:1-aminocyclopropane-1-carboxylate synthase